MTVGIGAVCENGSEDAKVVISSDRLVTTLQQSRIEHEHPETKLIEFGDYLGETHLVGIIAGSVQLGESLQSEIEAGIRRFVEQENDEPWVSTAAKIAGERYRKVVKMKIEDVALQPYGLELDDLTKQHQFKDDFLDDVLAEADEIRQTIHGNLTLLLGGVGPTGPGLYQIAQNDVQPQNDMGYATIGSGIQPAESEFIQTGYGKSDSLDRALATVAGAHHQAKAASGVGGEPDIKVIDSEGVHQVEENVRDQLMERQQSIADRQEEVKQQILNDESINWRP